METLSGSTLCFVKLGASVSSDSVDLLRLRAIPIPA
jgi:hypothetical protein